MQWEVRISSVRPKERRGKISDPLCTLFVTFCDMDYPQKEITTKHVFTTKKQRQYPQTRKVVLTPLRGKKRIMMSSPSTYIDQSEDELEHYERRRLGSAAQTYSSSSAHTTPGLYSNHVVQEVSLSYSAPLTVSPPSRDVPLTVQISQGEGIDDYGLVNSGGSLQDYLSQYEARIAKPRHIESVERVTSSGRHETEFPVRIAYIGGDSVTSPIHSVPIVPVGHPYRVYDSRATTPRITDTIIQETTTIEEMTTITTTNHRRSAGPEMAMSPTNVNALTQQFEQTARREYDEAQKTRRSPGQRSPPTSRVVVVHKPGSEYIQASEERVRRVDRHQYSPTGQRERVSTTIVDIDPAYRAPHPRYVEESYQLQEEFRTVKSYGGKKGVPVVHYASPEPQTQGYVKETIREHISISRSSSPSREPEREMSRGATPVRHVVEQFEGRIDTDTRRTGVSPAPYGHTESVDEYSVVKKETREKPKPTREVFIPKGDYIPSRPAPATPVATPEPRPPTPKEVVIPRTPTPKPEPRPPTPKEVFIPRAPTPPPPPPPKEIEIPKAEPRREDRNQVFTDRDVRVNAWEEITTTTRRREQEPPVKEEKPAEPKKDDAKLVSSSATVKPSTNMYSSSTYETNLKTTTRGDDIRSYTSPAPPSTTSYTTGGMTDTYIRSTYTSGASSRYRAPADIATGTLSGMSPFGQNAASAIRDAREREKKEMSDLNDRLASYIEKVRFLEAQNRKLANDLELLQSRWGSDSTSVRIMYETELKTAKVVIDESNRQRETLETDIRRLSAELAEYRKKYEDALASRDTSRLEADDLLNKLAKIEAEINLMKRRITYLEEEVGRIKRENQRLMGELSRTRSTIEQESLSRIDFQNQVQTLLEECQYVGRIHNNELGDLVVMAHRDTTPENREFFKNELAAAIRDIRAEYDQITHANRTDMESWYKLRVQEIHTQSNRNVLEQNYARDEVKKLRVTLVDMRSKLADLEGRNALLEKQIQELNYQLEDDQRSYEAALNERDSNIRKMRDECQALMVELQMLLDTKQTLDAEIAIYRKMLEGEENRAGLRQLVEQVVKTTSYGQQASTESVRVITSETSSRSNFQRSAKGNVSIHETSPDGRFIIIENTHRSKEENIGEWKLKRRVDGKKEYVYTFPREFVLRPMKSVKVFARGQGVHSPPDSLVYDGEENWGTGNSVQTYLYNKDGEERATLIQRQSFS